MIDWLLQTFISHTAILQSSISLPDLANTGISFLASHARPPSKKNTSLQFLYSIPVFFSLSSLVIPFARLPAFVRSSPIIVFTHARTRTLTHTQQKRKPSTTFSVFLTPHSHPPLSSSYPTTIQQRSYNDPSTFIHLYLYVYTVSHSFILSFIHLFHFLTHAPSTTRHSNTYSTSTSTTYPHCIPPIPTIGRSYHAPHTSPWLFKTKKETQQNFHKKFFLKTRKDTFPDFQ